MALFLSIPTKLADRVNPTESNQTKGDGVSIPSLYIMTSNIFRAKWEIHSFPYGPISSCKPIVILLIPKSFEGYNNRLYIISILGSPTHIFRTYMTYHYGCVVFFPPMWSVLASGNSQVSHPLSPCLSLLLSSYPLTHILVITSGVPCRNSISPPLPSSFRHKTVSLSLNTGPAFHFHLLSDSDRGRQEDVFSSPLLLGGMAATITCHLSPVASSLDPRQLACLAPRACLMLPEVLLFHGSRCRWWNSLTHDFVQVCLSQSTWPTFLLWHSKLDTFACMVEVMSVKTLTCFWLVHPRRPCYTVLFKSTWNLENFL